MPGLGRVDGALKTISEDALRGSRPGGNFESELTPAELGDLRRLVGFMVPSSADYRVPGANDGAIFADIIRSLGRDQSAVRKALAVLREMAGGDFAAIDEAEAEATAMALLRREGPEITALGRAVLQCYYREWRAARRPRDPSSTSHKICAFRRAIPSLRGRRVGNVFVAHAERRMVGTLRFAHPTKPDAKRVAVRKTHDVFIAPRRGGMLVFQAAGL